MNEYEKYRVWLAGAQVVATLVSPCIMLYFVNKREK